MVSELKTVDFIYFHFISYFYFLSYLFFLFLDLELSVSIILYMTVISVTYQVIYVTVTSHYHTIT